jgi:hypothetical protein
LRGDFQRHHVERIGGGVDTGAARALGERARLRADLGNLVAPLEREQRAAHHRLVRGGSAARKPACRAMAMSLGSTKENRSNMSIGEGGVGIA